MKICDFPFLLFLRKDEKTPETLDFTGLSGEVFGVPEGSRTPDLSLRRRTLYPTELLRHLRIFKALIAKKTPLRCLFYGDPDGNRTRVTAVKGRCLNRLTTGPLVALTGFEPVTLRV